MSEDLNTGAKIAISMVVVAFVLSIGLAIMAVGQHFWNKTTERIERPVASVVDSDAYSMSNYGGSIPVPTVWKLIKRIDYDSGGTGTNVKSFSLYHRDGTTLVANGHDIATLDQYLDQKCFLSWSVDDRTGLYTLEVVLDD